MSAIDRALMVKAAASDASRALTGGADLLLARGAASRCIEIFNASNAAIGMTFTGNNPTMGNAGTITIPSGGTWRSFEGFIPYSDIYVKGTAGGNVTCWYY